MQLDAQRTYCFVRLDKPMTSSDKIDDFGYSLLLCIRQFATLDSTVCNGIFDTESTICYCGFYGLLLCMRQFAAVDSTGHCLQ
jgi:hypothetical protein